MVLNGDLPLIQPETIQRFAETVATGTAAGAVLSMLPPDSFGYGRIVLTMRAPSIEIVEQKEAHARPGRRIQECNAGCYAFDGALLAAHIDEINNDNAQGEYYLPDMLAILREAGQRVTSFCCDDYRDGLGVNSRAQLANSPPSRAIASTRPSWRRASPSSTPPSLGSGRIAPSAATR